MASLTAGPAPRLTTQDGIYTCNYMWPAWLLCCCCRYEEALAAYDKLLNCDGNWYNYSSYVNVMALYPFVVLAARGPKVGGGVVHLVHQCMQQVARLPHLSDRDSSFLLAALSLHTYTPSYLVTERMST